MNDRITQKWKDETIKQAHELAKRENKKGGCNICGEETELYCKSCEDKEEDFRLWYCEKHYQSVVLTGNCCSGNEKIYN